MAEEITFFGETTFRNERRKFGIKLDDRRKHVYIIGKTGMGKTQLLKNLAIQDIRNGHGIGFVDPHGEAASELLDYVPQERLKDVVYFNPADLDYPISFNVMEKVDIEFRHLVASGLMGVFKKIWPDVWSARMEYILNNCILSLLEYPGSTLLGVNRLLADEEYRAKVVEQIKDPIVKSFWLNEFAKYSQRYETEATAAIQNKIGQFISSPLIRNIIGQTQSSIDMRAIMDQGKILIMDLSKGRIGEDSSKLLGGLLITKLQLAAMSRVDTPEEDRKDFFLYVDEFQNFATESFANILSEARKYRLDLTLGHQYIAQMEETVRDAVFGNVGTMIVFRVGAEDAEFLEKEFAPKLTANDIVNLGKYNVYVKLMVDGIASDPFSAQTLAGFDKQEYSEKENIIKFSREHYASERENIEEEIARWTGDFVLRKDIKKPIELYDAVCQECKKTTKVPFKPDNKRPVFCKTCLKKLEAENNPENQPSNQPAEISAETNQEPRKGSLEELLLRNTISFSKKQQAVVKKEKQVINKEKLKEAIKESLEDIKNQEQEKQAKEKMEKVKEISPGQTIQF
ncbi:MAG: type IV secretion system DNA-binding domain-containing protein [Candidatus Pacebacteria bacterium]|nr:type IV secretion system DNA-binding domain-containing protein [Candidatus Paceibacterota bacterium]